MKLLFCILVFIIFGLIGGFFAWAVGAPNWAVQLSAFFFGAMHELVFRGSTQ